MEDCRHQRRSKQQAVGNVYMFCQSLSRTGVPINGQQIVLPLRLLWGRLLGKDHGKEAGLGMTVVLLRCSIFCVGRENGAVRWVCPNPVHYSGGKLPVLLEAPAPPPGSQFGREGQECCSQTHNTCVWLQVLKKPYTWCVTSLTTA